VFLNILSPVDGSPDADAALSQAIDLADSEHSRLTLLTGVVAPPVIAYFGAAGAAVAGMIAEAEAEADRVLRRAATSFPTICRSTPRGCSLRPRFRVAW
jgi:nucleotide-binding universal stress UspA family protein